jgi:hypothetical protein
VELELDVPGIHGKLLEYIVHSTRRKKWKAIISLHTSNLNREQPIFCFKVERLFGLEYIGAIDMQNLNSTQPFKIQ